MRRAATTLLFAWTILSAAEAAETVSVKVVSLADATVGVRSAVVADDGGGAPVRVRTDRGGAATLEVARCDDALGISADPALPYLPSGRFDCARALTIPVALPRFAAALAPALADARPAAAPPSPPSPPIEEASAAQTPFGGLVDFFRGIFVTRPVEAPAPVAPSLRGALAAALDGQQDAAAARAAAGLAAEARSGDPALAGSYDALAAAAAFRAIGLEAGAADPPLMEPAGAGVAMTEAGRAAVAAFQARAGLPATGQWTAETLAALR